MHGSVVFRSIAALVPGARVCGCTNFGALRDFAAASAWMADYCGVTERHLRTADGELTEPPTYPRFDLTCSSLRALKATTAQDNVTLLRLHATTPDYMACWPVSPARTAR